MARSALLRSLARHRSTFSSPARSVQHVPVRFFAKEAATRPVLKGDEMLKGVFMEVKTKFEKALAVFRKEKITIAPEDPTAVKHYAKVMETARKEADMYSEAQRIQYSIEEATHNIPDARSYLEALKDLRVKRGLIDEIGIEPLMMEAVDKIEKDIKKPLMREDKKNMALLTAEFEKINKKIGIKKEDLQKLEQELEIKMAKSQLEDLKKTCVEAMETQKKREEFKDEEVPDVKTLDVRNFL